MGWAFCGDDAQGRPVGYGVVAGCDEPGCTETIDRGLDYVCGSTHFGGNGDGCGRYFCGKHRHDHACEFETDDDDDDEPIPQPTAHEE